MQVSSPCVLPGDRQLRVVEKISGGHRDLLSRKAVEREDGVRCLRVLRWVRA